MRFAVIGLALSHPYAFADILTRWGHSISAVWDYDPGRAAEFGARFGAQVAAAPGAALGLPGAPGATSAPAPDGAIITSYTSDHFAHARLALQAGIPCYIDKLLTLTPAEAEVLVAIGTPFLTGSALRFMPGVTETALGIGRPLTARAEVYHGLSSYLQSGNTWQDDPARSGGVLMNMGIHAIDLLVAALGPHWAVAAAETARRVHPNALSEDQAAVLLRNKEGLLATVQVVSSTERHHYALTVTGTEGDGHWQYPDPARPGADVYGPMLTAFAETIRTRAWQVPPADLLAPVRILASARQAAAIPPKEETTWTN
ncbi:MAG: hypothetical protein K0R39_4016 [Symbiobacteriaceae bacterium]|jgi:predicted dehydrogenase|nr:hypothetical protein [Symbiobacteriaceae bacterium]